MIGKPEWFTYRIFGWGIRPKTWQGWVYLAFFAGILGFTAAVTINRAANAWVFGIVGGLLMLDIIHIMTKMPKVHDERENQHQLIIERNVSFAAILAILGVVLFQTFQNAEIARAGGYPFDMSLMVVLGVMVVVKAASYGYLKWKM